MAYATQRHLLKSVSTYLRPGNTPKTASVFSSLQAICEFRKTRSCDRNDLSERGREFCCDRVEDKYQCVGDKSTTTLRWEDLSIFAFLSADRLAGVPGSWYTRKSVVYDGTEFVCWSLRTTNGRGEEAGFELNSAAAVATIGPRPG